MNFQKIAPVDQATQILDIAFRKAREKGKNKALHGNWLQKIRSKESLKLDFIKDRINTTLEKIIADFPKYIELPQFYQKLMPLTLDVDKFRISLGKLNQATRNIFKLHKTFVSAITKSTTKEEINSLSTQFYGRLSSIIKKINPHLLDLEKYRRIMRNYPDIKEMFTVCIYGFPNVGKSTLLNKLTTSKAEVAAYAFTTKSINAGYLKVGEQKVQILDVPGTLARKEKMNNIELQAELVAKDVANIIIYVFDLTENCGYSVKKQEQLYNNLSKNKEILVYLSKKDLLDAKKVAEFKYPNYTFEEIKEKILQLNLQSSKEEHQENPED